MKKKTTNPTPPRGFITLPAESGQEETVMQLLKHWGADAIRDSDGTMLSPELLALGYDVYSTICLVRADQQWPQKHPDKLPQKFLMSDFVTACSSIVHIDPMEGYFREKYRIDTLHDPKTWWQVFDRTTGQEAKAADWEFDAQTGRVTIRSAQPFHLYTVNFLVYQIWDSTSMYNHITNNWTCPHVVSTEPYHPDARRHLMAYFDQWLRERPHTDVVRLTTLAYHFVLDSDPQGTDKYRDWMGYMDTVTVEALLDFEKEYGYRLTSEDFVDQGYYNATHRVPTRRYKDWMQFIHRFVIAFGRELVEKIHAAGKKAAMFQGDHWIGTEPYSPHFGKMGIDINIGAVEDGVALRRLSDSPNKEIKEARLYPYFFPDVFHPGGNPLAESLSNWLKIRRALLRKPIDRIGYGGYLSLAAQFPRFVEHVETLCGEFRTILANSRKTASYKAPVKVAVLNAWGSIRSWLNNFGSEQKFFVKRPDVVAVAGSNMLECLSGLPVEVVFLSFDEVLAGGIPDDIHVLINDGQAYTSWSGGSWWTNEKILSAVRQFVYAGGGFIGVQEPAACEYQGRFFQLSDVLGVQKETGLSVMTAAVKFSLQPQHFITADATETLDWGLEKSFVYPACKTTQVLRTGGDLHLLLTGRTCGSGRGVYMAGLPYSLANARLLYRAILWAAGREDALNKWFCTNLNTDCAYYPETGMYVVVNNTESEQMTTLFRDNGQTADITLKPCECRWFSL
ncbi:MAG: 1,3-beta-galactosyl-N-acetylhexosamine phosphorylase [Planctomycetales bacterium]|nr:1,3-beta-galactosyl-N-acetylhexosamine phosphorylase [Planctomycetales bacterium]